MYNRGQRSRRPVSPFEVTSGRTRQIMTDTREAGVQRDKGFRKTQEQSEAFPRRRGMPPAFGSFCGENCVFTWAGLERLEPISIDRKGRPRVLY